MITFLGEHVIQVFQYRNVQTEAQTASPQLDARCVVLGRAKRREGYRLLSAVRRLSLTGVSSNRRMKAIGLSAFRSPRCSATPSTE